MALLSSLTDNFNTAGAIDGTKWSFSNLGLYGSASYAGGALVCDAGTTVAFNGECHITSVSSYDMTNDGAYIKLPLVSSDPTKTETHFQIESSSNGTNERLYFYIEGPTGNIYVVAADSSGTGVFGTTLTYSSTNHVWFRIRHSSGNILWDTASSSASNPPLSGDWTNQGSFASSSLGWTGSITSVKVHLKFRLVATATSSAPTAQWDGFNTSSGTSNATYNFDRTETATVTTSASALIGYAVARTEAPTVTTTATTGTAQFANLVETAAVTQTSQSSFAYQSAITETSAVTATATAVRVYFGTITETTPVTDYTVGSQFWNVINTGAGTAWTPIST